MAVTRFAPLALALLLASTAHATPLSVVETTDFAEFPDPPTFVGTLDLGTNTISGHVDQATDPGGDLVSADLPTGLQITAISLEISNFGGSGQTTSTTALVSPLTIIEQQHLSADGTYPFSNGLPITEADLYGFGSEIRVESANVSYDWKWSIVVTPEPASGLLLAMGMGVLSGARSPRRARR
jgi:hypothetical protein